MMKPRYPVCKELAWLEPHVLQQSLDAHNGIWLDSAQKDSHRGRVSYLAIDPFHKWVLKRGLLNDQPLKCKPFRALKNEISKYSLTKLDKRPAFQGGVAGFFSYDLAWYYEDLPNHARQEPDFEDWILGFYDLVIAFDHILKKSWVFSTGFPEQEEEKRIKRAHQRMDWLLHLVHAKSDETIKRAFTFHWQRTEDETSYMKKVAQTCEFIRAGDIFEANISQRFSTPFNQSDLPSLYAHLRMKNPAPFAAWLRFDETQILSASPERFIHLDGKFVETRPIKGTMARSLDPSQDQLIQQKLSSSEKDIAENVMIVDLMRNDLSKVCIPSSVEVPQLCQVESFAQVHHLVSCVKGELKAGLGAIDVLEATFPGGSITGAPKIRAMEIIEELEPFKRGPYCGSIGFIAFHGDMDTSITIRTYAFKENTLVFGAGGAVTLDSDPKAEYLESMAKARALLEEPE